MLADAARRHGKPVEIVAIQAEGGTVRATEKGIAHRASVRRDAGASQEREPCDASELVLSLKCGGSDYTSGLASNPTLGRVTDRLVELGGSAVLGEIAEIMGAEHLLASRATQPATAHETDPDHHPRREPKRARSGSTSAARSRRRATSAAV